jgi:protein ImuA
MTLPPLPLPDLDGAPPQLPQGGLAAGAVHEMRGVEGGFAHLAFLVLLLAQAGGALPGEVPVLWVSAVQNAYPPGLAWLGLDPGKIFFAQGRDDAACLASLEVGLRGGMAGIAEVGGLSRLAARRLALAAREGGGWGFVLRHAARRTPQDSAACATRWFIEPAPGGFRAELLYAKGGRPGVFFYEVTEGDHDKTPPALTAVTEWAVSERAERRRRAAG